jgi:hypothetical protein
LKYPDVPLEDWLKKYPSLTVNKVECFECKKEVTIDKPWMTLHFAGLIAKKCPHCKAKCGAFVYTDKKVM